VQPFGARRIVVHDWILVGSEMLNLIARSTVKLGKVERRIAEEAKSDRHHNKSLSQQA